MSAAERKDARKSSGKRKNGTHAQWHWHIAVGGAAVWDDVEQSAGQIAVARCMKWNSLLPHSMAATSSAVFCFLLFDTHSLLSSVVASTLFTLFVTQFPCTAAEVQ